jgi:hypothetical protein
MTLPPIPPSDNLYKFTAIGGLILAVLSLYIPWKMSSDLQMASYDLDWDMKKLRLETAQSKSEVLDATENMQSLNEGITEFLKNLHNKNLNPPNKFDMQNWEKIKAELQEHWQNHLAFEKNILEKDILLAKIENTSAKQIYAEKRAFFLFLISMGTLVVGLIMTVFGFWNWYFKFQIYQDQIVKAQAKQWTKTRTTESEKEEIPEIAQEAPKDRPQEPI